MTVTLTLQALRSYLMSQDIEVPIWISGDQSDLTPPYIHLKVTGSDEHEVLLGVYQFSIEAALVTVPREDEGTSVEDKDELEADVYEVLADNTGFLQWAESEEETTNVRFFEMRVSENQSEEADDALGSIFNITTTTCKITN